MKFGDKLSQLRRKAGLSQEELGEQLNVTRQTISKWELGQSKPDTDKLMEISKLLNVDFSQLADDEMTIDNNMNTLNSDLSADEVRPRKWLLILLIIIAIGIVIFLLNGYITDKKARDEANDGKTSSLFDIFNGFTEVIDEVSNSSLIENQLYEQYAGTEAGHSVESLLDHIITNNKKNKDKTVTVIFNDINSSDPNEIKKAKQYLDNFDDYEVSFEYDDNGRIYEVTIEKQESYSDSDIRFFNSTYEFYAGTTNGSQVNFMIDKIITNNKTKQDRVIRVVYGGVDTVDETEIRNLKKNFGDVWTNYEVILDYDEIGFVNKVTIEN